MDYDDLMKISAENLRQLVPKMGPANKILDARKVLRTENGSTSGSNSKYYVSDDEDDVAAQSEVIFLLESN